MTHSFFISLAPSSKSQEWSAAARLFLGSTCDMPPIRPHGPPETGDLDNPDVYYCGCMACLDKGKSWRSRTIWYEHKRDREAQQAAGQIPARNPLHRIPTRTRTHRKHARLYEDGLMADMGQMHPRHRAGTVENGNPIDPDQVGSSAIAIVCS